MAVHSTMGDLKEEGQNGGGGGAAEQGNRPLFVDTSENGLNDQPLTNGSGQATNRGSREWFGCNYGCGSYFTTQESENMQTHLGAVPFLFQLCTNVPRAVRMHT